MQRTLTIQLLVALLAATAVSTMALATDSPSTVPLWPGNAPVGDGTYEAVTSELKIYLPPPDKATGAAVVICPGGGYIRHVVDREGYPIADWLTGEWDRRHPVGVSSARRPYVGAASRCPARHPVHTREGRGVEDRSAAHRHPWLLGRWSVASSAGTHFDAGRAGNADPIEGVSCRPDFMLLVYPVVTMGEKTHELSKTKLLGAKPQPELVQLFSNETQVTDQTPPAFLGPRARRHGRAAGQQPLVRRGPEGASRSGGIPRTPFRRSRFQRLPRPALGGMEAKSLAWLASQKLIPSNGP